LTLGGILPAAFQPFLHRQNAQKSAFLEKFILRKIIKIDATRCQMLRLKCTKSFVGWDSAPDPVGGAYSKGQGKWGRTEESGGGGSLLHESRGDRRP